MSWTEILTVIGYYAVYPLVVIVPPILSLLKVLFAPLTHVFIVLGHILLFPIRILGSLETLYVFFGVAALIGASAGCALHFTLRVIYRFLSLDEPALPQSRRGEKLQAQLRRGKLVRGVEDESDDEEDIRGGYAGDEEDEEQQARYSKGWPSEFQEKLTSGRLGPTGLLSSTILEESSRAEEDESS